MNPLLQQFILESRESLQQIVYRILDLEGSKQDTGAINDLFRLVHTLKGNSGLFEFAALTRVLHVAEDLLDRIREGRLELDREVADELLSITDFVTKILDQIEQEGELPESIEAEGNELESRLRNLLQEAFQALPKDEDGELQGIAGVKPPADWDWINQLAGADRESAQAAACSGQLMALHYVPDPECYFKGDDPLLTMRNVPGLIGMRISPIEPWPEPEAFDVYRSNLVFDALSTATKGDLQEHFRYVSEQVAIYPVPEETLINLQKQPAEKRANCDQAPRSDGESQRKESSGQVLSGEQDIIWKSVWETQRFLMTMPVPSDQWSGRLTSIAAVLSGLLRYKAETPGLSQLESAVERARQTRTFAPIVELMDQLSSLVKGSELRVSENASAQESSTRSPGFEAQNQLSSLSDQIHPKPPADRSPAKDLRVLKVSQEKVDKLMELIGELVVAKNALPYLAARAENDFGITELGREIKAHYGVVHRIAEDMHDAIMQVRMLPVGVMFQRFPRLVRDLARQSKKEVRLIMEGEDTEADKNVIEALADPLVHLIRNSLDHGIELPEDREAMGKSREGTLAVRARQEGDRVLIEVEDDGRGIDPIQVKLKAFEKGLIDEDRIEGLTDQQALQLVFLPGFSTSEEISQVSGRGVGMDVVRTAVEGLGGAVGLESRKGEGTRVVMGLPLSMAVSHVMVMEFSGQRYGIPIEQVVETVRLPAREIHTLKDKKAAVLRGRIVPLYGAEELLNFGEPAKANAEGEHAVLLVRVGSETLGLMVDKFSETTDVILKPLEGPLAGLKGFAGTALLGDGTVLLVINLKELL
jgi:two-component system chemotaxis sensor kinase CheA